ncbi:MAG TPA: hypothetical protein VGI19_13585 [Candidatus Cybelea sp.]|jgi:sugar lactone lactonase YvrE
MKRSIFVTRLQICATLALLAGCRGSQPPIGAPGATPQTSAAAAHADRGTSWMLPEAGRRGAFAGGRSFLYATDCCGLFNNGDVNVYPPTLERLDRRIVRGAGNAAAIAVSHTDTLYVLNSGSGYYTGIAVTEWDKSAKRPSRRVKGFVWAIAIAVDQSDNLYVADCNTCPDGDLAQKKVRDSVFVYQTRQTKLWRTITQGVHSPRSITVDADGYLYVANVPNSSTKRRPSIAVYAPGATTPLRVIARGITRPGLLTTDNQEDLFVANGGGEILEYSPRGMLLRKMTHQVNNPTGLALDASGTLYVANTYQYPAKGSISVYTAGSSKSSYVVVDGMNHPVALAVSGAGELYVANDDWGNRAAGVALRSTDRRHKNRYARSVAASLVCQPRSRSILADAAARGPGRDAPNAPPSTMHRREYRKSLMPYSVFDA